MPFHTQFQIIIINLSLLAFLILIVFGIVLNKSINFCQKKATFSGIFKLVTARYKCARCHGVQMSVAVYKNVLKTVFFHLFL